MFSFLVPPSPSVPQTKENVVPSKDEYDKARISYLKRHPETTEEDFDMIKKEKGDLECLFLWGATPEDMNDAGIIARYDPDRINTPAGADIHQPSTEEKATEHPFHLPKVTIFPVSEPVVQMTPLRVETPLPTPPSLSLPIFTAFDAPNENVLKMPSPAPASAPAPAPAPAPPTSMLFIPSFFDLSQSHPQGREGTVMDHASQPSQLPQQQPSIFLPHFTLFNGAVPATLPSEDESKAPASTSLFLPAFFDMSPRR